MPPRARRAVASLGMVVFLGVYVWAAIAVADLLPESALIDALYFVIAGTAWGLPLFPLIKWAEHKD
ncbi:DUF2842 domain-containing protein [Brevundimonas sp.]|jgi:hypothetical protein|uniref:DUF2842 domain-containing protein n=1 Tax=Brevundimonas sp. TaxID=1871086 RepID=UPI002E0EB8D7|nr:DUF2842 domain-containing protein [Brevundimonas sp.]